MAACDVVYRACQSGQRQVPGIVDDRREQTLLGVDRETEVFGVVVGDLAGVLVVAGVDIGMGLERVDDGAGDERQEGEVDALSFGEVLLGLGPQRDDLGHVGLVGLGELRGRLQ
jgi:hypothetical protein